MKKKLLIIFLFINFNLFAQFTFNSSSIINTVDYKISKTNGTNNCITSLTVDYSLPEILSGQDGWGAYFYTFNVYIIGYRTNGTSSTILKESFYPNNYSFYSSQRYFYRTSVVQNQISENYTSLKAKFEVIKHVSNNDPEMTIFFEYMGDTVKWTSQISSCVDENAKPDLNFNNFNISGSAGTHSDGSPLIDKYGAIEFDSSTKNSGTKDAESFDISVFINQSSTLNVANPGGAIESKYVPSLKIGNSEVYNGTIYATSITHVFSSSGYYYVHIFIDNYTEVTESNENNNVKTQKVYFNMSSSKPPFPPKELEYQSKQVYNNSNVNSPPYTVYIHTFSQNKVLEKTVFNQKEENILVQELPKGIYIVNSKYGSRKVYSN
jgi:CARDB protein